jgi:hypothetical protein
MRPRTSFESLTGLTGGSRAQVLDRLLAHRYPGGLRWLDLAAVLLSSAQSVYSSVGEKQVTRATLWNNFSKGY